MKNLLNILPFKKPENRYGSETRFFRYLDDEGKPKFHREIHLIDTEAGQSVLSGSSPDDDDSIVFLVSHDADHFESLTTGETHAEEAYNTAYHEACNENILKDPNVKVSRRFSDGFDYNGASSGSLVRKPYEEENFGDWIWVIEQVRPRIQSFFKRENFFSCLRPCRLENPIPSTFLTKKKSLWRTVVDLGFTKKSNTNIPTSFDETESFFGWCDLPEVTRIKAKTLLDAMDECDVPESERGEFVQGLRQYFSESKT